MNGHSGVDTPFGSKEGTKPISLCTLVVRSFFPLEYKSELKFLTGYMVVVRHIKSRRNGTTIRYDDATLGRTGGIWLLFSLMLDIVACFF